MSSNQNIDNLRQLSASQSEQDRKTFSRLFHDATKNQFAAAVDLQQRFKQKEVVPPQEITAFRQTAKDYEGIVLSVRSSLPKNQFVAALELIKKNTQILALFGHTEKQDAVINRSTEPQEKQLRQQLRPIIAEKLRVSQSLARKDAWSQQQFETFATFCADFENWFTTQRAVLSDSMSLDVLTILKENSKVLPLLKTLVVPNAKGAREAVSQPNQEVQKQRSLAEQVLSQVLWRKLRNYQD